MIYRPNLLGTFKTVEAKYNSIKPLVSKHHKREDDIRPLGDRRRKWERIEKVNNNKYVLHDAIVSENNYPATNSYWERYLLRPPITWERKGNKEFVTVRPNIQMAHDTSRYQFLRAYLPSGLYFDNHTKHGRHLVNNVFIARPKGGEDNTDYHLTFERNDLRWKCVTEPWSETRPAVDKEKKAELRADLEQFYEWMCSVGPLLDTGYENIRHLREEALNEVMATRPFDSDHINVSYRLDFHVDVALEIVKDYNHPLRTHLATNFLSRVDIKAIQTIEDEREFRASYNSWANKAFGLMTEKETTNV